MSFSIKTGGSWSELASAWLKTASSWEEIQSAWIKVAGTWQKVYDNIIWILQGTSGSPVSQSYVAVQPDEANVIWSITGTTGGLNNRVKGYVQYDKYNTGDSISLVNQHAFHADLSGWSVIYVRLTAHSGVADSSTHAINGTTWHTLTEDVTTAIQWTETHDGVIAENCVVKVEFCTVGDGSNIVATGYYSSTVSATP